MEDLKLYLQIGTAALVFIGFVWAAARDVVTKKDCQDCQVDIDRDFNKGSQKFSEMQGALAEMNQTVSTLAGQVQEIGANVRTILNHHMGPSK